MVMCTTVLAWWLAVVTKLVLYCVGDWHCAYVLLYGPRVVEVTEDVAMETEQETSPAAEVSS